MVSPLPIFEKKRKFYMDMMVLIQQLIKFFILMSVGYALYKLKIMDSDFNKKLTNLVLRVCNPCMMIASVFSISEDRNIGKVLSVFAVAIVMYALLPAIGMGIAKIIGAKDGDVGLYVFMTIFSNIGFMGFPLIESLLGPEALFYAAIFNMMFNIMLFTAGVKAVNYPDAEGKSASFKEIALHPGVISAVIAIILYFANLHLPVVVTGPIDQIGDMTPPLAMLLMGASLAKIPVKDVFNEKKAYIFIAIKQIALPIIAWFVIKRIITDDMIRAVTLIMLSMPIANSVVMFTIEYDRNEELAAKEVFISTVASMVLLPLVIYLTYLH